jgi:anti-sigma B factor antagonist
MNLNPDKQFDSFDLQRNIIYQIKNIAKYFFFYYAIWMKDRGKNMDIKVTESPNRINVTLRGDIYVDQTDELLDTFNGIIEKSPEEVVIDIKDLKSITSSGIGKIVLLYKGLNQKNGKIKIIGVNETIMQIFRVVKLDKLVEIVEA